MLAVSSLNTINSFIARALSDDSISDEEYSLILLELETFARMKEDLREKSKMSLEKTGNIDTEANELLRGNKIGVPFWVHVHVHVQNHVQNHVRNHVQNYVQSHAQNHVQNHAKNYVQNRVRKNKNIANKDMAFLKISNPKKRVYS